MNDENERLIKEQIDAYIHGKLTEQETEELWAVLVEDGEYYNYLKTAANLKAINTSKNSRRVPFLRKPAYAAAAVIILLVAVFGIFKFIYVSPDPPMQAITSIEVPLQRSVDVEPSKNQSNIVREAVLLSYNNKFDKAVDLLQSTRMKTKNISYKARLSMMLGTLFYNKAKFRKAKNYFLAIISSKDQLKPLQVEKAYWYLANTWLELSNLDQARLAIQQVIKIDGAYSRVAKRYLQDIENRSN